MHKSKKPEFVIDEKGLQRAIAEANEHKGLYKIDMKWQSPRTFLSKVPLTDMVKKTSTLNLKYRLRKHKPLEPLWLDLNKKRKVFRHEGRHRARISRDLGIKKVPIVYFYFKNR